MKKNNNIKLECEAEKRETYDAPALEIVEVKVERGFNDEYGELSGDEPRGKPSY